MAREYKDQKNAETEAKIYNLRPFPAVTVRLHQRIRPDKGCHHRLPHERTADVHHRTV